MHVSHRSARSALIALIFAAVLSACGGGHPAAGGSGSAVPTYRSSPITSYGEITYTVTYTLSGALTASGTYTRPLSSAIAPTCALSAQKGNEFSQAGTFNVPEPPDNAYPVVAVTVSGYRGPGTYMSATDTALAGELTADSSSPVYNVSADGTGATLSVALDGSGSYTFTNAQPEGPTTTASASPGLAAPSPTTTGTATASPSATSLSGSFNWACSG